MENKNQNLISDSVTGNRINQYPLAFGEEDLSIKDLIKKLEQWWMYILTKWLLIIVFSIIGGALALLYAYSQRPVYTAELTFVLEDEQPTVGAGAYASIAGQFGFDLGAGSGGGVFAGDNLLALMKSRSMIEKALLTIVNVNGKKQTLADYYIEINRLRQKWAKKSPELQNVHFLPGQDPRTFSVNQNALIRTFHGILTSRNLSVDKQDKKAGIISLRVNSENELFSKYFTEALAKEVSNFYIETKTKRAAENLAILQYQTDSIKRAFNLALSGVAVSSDANPNANPAKQILKVPSVRKQFDVQVNQAILTQLVQNLEIAKVSLRKETPLIQVIDKPILPLPKASPSPFRNLIFGAIFGAFIIVFLLTVKRIYNSFMK